MFSCLESQIHFIFPEVSSEGFIVINYIVVIYCWAKCNFVLYMLSLCMYFHFSTMYSRHTYTVYLHMM